MSDHKTYRYTDLMCSPVQDNKALSRRVQWVTRLSVSDFSHHHSQATATLGLLYSLSCVLVLPAWGGPFPALHWVSRDQPPPPTLIPLHHPHTHHSLNLLTVLGTVVCFVSFHFLSPNTWTKTLLHDEGEGEKTPSLHHHWAGLGYGQGLWFANMSW